MAITKSAQKRIKSNETKRVFNLRRTRTMREEVKDFKSAVAKGDVEAAKMQVATLYKAIDKAAKRGVIKDNTAARKKSRLMQSLKKASE